MTKPPSLWPHQIEAVQATLDLLPTGEWRPAIVLPTGTGKTPTGCELAARWINDNPGRRVLFLVHRDELAQQASRRFRTWQRDLDVGIVKAVQNDVDAEVIIASIQTLQNDKRLQQVTDVGLVIIDECHHATSASYRKIMNHYSCHEPDGARLVGLTATLMRSDGQRLGDVFNRISYGPEHLSIVTAIRRGFLVDVKAVRIEVDDLDISQVKKTAGDLDSGQLGEAILASMAPTVVADKYLELCPDLPGILFAPTVETARMFAEAFEDVGIRSATIWGDMDKTERRNILADYERGKIQVLHNCMVLTEGFDSPRAQVAVIARATASQPLYVQMVGRVLRQFQGKGNALVLDVVGATARHALATLATLAGEAPVTPKDGQTLLEALDAATDVCWICERPVFRPGDDHDWNPAIFCKCERESDAGLMHTGPVKVADVDLFHGSRQSWYQTNAGFWFIAAGERIITVAPSAEPGGHDVLWYARTKGAMVAGKGGGWIARDVESLPLAQSLAEADITPKEDILTRKEAPSGASWKTRLVSPAALKYARSLGLDIHEKERAGAVAEKIAILQASKRVDPHLLKHLHKIGVGA